MSRNIGTHFVLPSSLTVVGHGEIIPLSACVFSGSTLQETTLIKALENPIYRLHYFSIHMGSIDLENAIQMTNPERSMVQLGLIRVFSPLKVVFGLDGRPRVKTGYFHWLLHPSYLSPRFLQHNRLSRWRVERNSWDMKWEFWTFIILSKVWNVFIIFSFYIDSQSIDISSSRLIFSLFYCPAANSCKMTLWRNSTTTATSWALCCRRASAPVQVLFYTSSSKLRRLNLR